MKPITEKQRQFILDTLLPYKNDPGTCGYNEVDEMCEYLTNNGKKCAVGKHMKIGKWQHYNMDIVCLASDFNFDLEEMLTNEAFEMKLSIKQWQAIQSYHDDIAMSMNTENTVINLEELTGISFPELK